MAIQTRIFVLDRGFVFVGKSESVDRMGLWIPVTQARCIRRWGTTDGLAELINGPTSDTVMDPLCEVLIPIRALIHTVEGLNQEKWEKHLTVGKKGAK